MRQFGLWLMLSRMFIFVKKKKRITSLRLTARSSDTGCGSSAFPSILRDRIAIPGDGVENRARVVSVVFIHEELLETDAAVLTFVEACVKEATVRLGDGAER